MAGHGKTRTTPFRILAYFLYGKYDWIEHINYGKIRVHTGPATRTLRMRSADFWTYLYWLETYKLIGKVEKEQKRGAVIIHLKLPLPWDVHAPKIEPSPLSPEEQEPLNE